MYRRPKPLKMYPTWEKSNASKFRRIRAKYGLVKLPPLVAMQIKQPLPQKDNGLAKKPKLIVGEG